MTTRLHAAPLSAGKKAMQYAVPGSGVRTLLGAPEEPGDDEEEEEDEVFTPRPSILGLSMV